METQLMAMLLLVQGNSPSRISELSMLELSNICSQTLDWGICNSWLAWCVDFWGLLTKVSCTHSTVSANGPGQAVRFAAHRQPLCWNFFVRRWFCVVLSPKPLLQHHNWLSFDKFLDTERFLILCPCHVSSWLPPSSETCKYTMVPITQTNLERYSTYCYAPFCCACLGCCTAKFGISGGTYELPCIPWNFLSNKNPLEVWPEFTKQTSVICTKLVITKGLIWNDRPGTS
jgi:hypothetical protein